MRDDTIPAKEAALLIRPLPRTMLTGEEPIRFGGRPRLPAHVHWPERIPGEPLHFIAEIDLARLTKAATGRSIPNLPSTGSLFVFLPLTYDALYQQDCARVLYAPEDVSDLPERPLPEAIGDIRTMDPNHVHEDGTTDDGRCLVRQFAEGLPFASKRRVNPLGANMLEDAGADSSLMRRAADTQEAEMARALRDARPLPSPTGSVPSEAFLRIPSDIRGYTSGVQAWHLSWAFIFDWAQDFLGRAHDQTIEYLAEMRDAGDSSRRIPRLITKLKSKRDQILARDFGKGRKPIFWTFENPVPVKENYDWQAERWLALSQFAKGPLPRQMLDSFVDMLVEIERHYKEDPAGRFRIGVLDWRVKGHQLTAKASRHMAKRAFEHASVEAIRRDGTEFDHLTQDERWDRRIIAAQSTRTDPRFSLGTLPLQMFGLGFEVQSAVTEHAEDVLLFQFGDSFGLPLEIGPDCILQLWIKPDDLAQGRFDDVMTTLDMT